MNKLPEEIYLHLGAHRTGSSAFQSVLDANANVFKQSRINLTTAPRVGKQEDTSFRLLFREYFRSMRKGSLLCFWHVHRTRRQIKQMLDSTHTHWVLSDENLLGPIVQNQKGGIYPQAKDNLRALKSLFGDRVVRIGLSIREYDQFIFSSFLMQNVYTNQRLKSLHDQYTNACHSIERGWLELVEDIRNYFPQAEICIWLHERVPMELRLQEFLSPLGLQLSNLDAIETINVAPTKEAIERIQFGRSERGEELSANEKDAILRQYQNGSRIRIDDYFPPELRKQMNKLYCEHQQELTGKS
jgi:hypothetical protein